MASFNRVMSAKQWGELLEFNRKVKAEVGTPIIDVDSLNLVRKAYVDRHEATKPIMAIPVAAKKEGDDDEEVDGSGGDSVVEAAVAKTAASAAAV